MKTAFEKAKVIIKKPYVYLPALGAVSAALSCLLEASALRLKAGYGKEGFSALAFIGGALLIFVALCAIFTRVGGESFDPSSRRQALLFAGTALFCVLICLSACDNVGKPVKYPMTQGEVEGSNPYVQQFDAFAKGQIELDLPVSDELAAMENPYDKSMRERLDVTYFWDRAFYNGRYYSYFGLAPLVCVYYPYYVLTGSLPSGVMVCLCLAVFTVFALALALREFLIYIGAKPRVWLMLTALISLAFGCGIYAAQSYGDVYHFPVLSAMGFNFLVFFFVFRAHRCEHTGRASALLGCASLAFVLAVMSRPTAALMCVAAAPALIDTTIIKAKQFKRTALLLAPAAIIAATGAAIVMTFNYLRFGSPIDFGANYQLTVNDISQNTLTLNLLGAAFAHYLLQRPAFIKEFPFLKPSYLHLEYGRYVYIDYMVGTVFFPSSLGLVAGAPFVRFGKDTLDRALTFVCGAAVIAAVMFIDFCKAGVNMRYLYDFLPLAVTLGSVLLLKLAGDGKSLPRRTVWSLIALICFCATVLMALGIIAANTNDRLFA